MSVRNKLENQALLATLTVFLHVSVSIDTTPDDGEAASNGGATELAPVADVPTCSQGRKTLSGDSGSFGEIAKDFSGSGRHPNIGPRLTESAKYAATFAGVPYTAASSAYHGWRRLGNLMRRMFANGRSALPYSTIARRSPWANPSLLGMYIVSPPGCLHTLPQCPITFLKVLLIDALSWLTIGRTVMKFRL